MLNCIVYIDIIRGAHKMREVILAKCGELVLKGMNRRSFEAVLLKNLKRRLQLIGNFDVSIAQSTVYVEPCDSAVDMDAAFERVLQVFGLVAAVRTMVVEKDMGAIFAAVCDRLGDKLQQARTFKVNARRSDKTFCMNSPQLCAKLGEDILESYPHLSVDVENPELTVFVEIREKGAYIHSGQTVAGGGVPVGTSGKALLMLSGGIDSPVAGYMMAKRGLQVASVHFESPPYTSERARQKVISLSELISPYIGRHRLYIVPFTKVQEELHSRCKSEYFTVVMRRYMLKIAERLAQHEGAAAVVTGESIAQVASQTLQSRCKSEYFTVVMRRYMLKIAERLAQHEGAAAVVTGESIAQVASQTLQAIACTDAAINMPILRPLIGMDKEEIVRIARKIGTFEVSTLPFEDCCTVFAPRHPRTKPKLVEVEQIEARLRLSDELIDECIESVTAVDIELR